MFDLAETVRSLIGAWRLLLNKPDALRLFDASTDGFWRSFAAIIPVAPLYFLTALTDRQSILADPTEAGTYSEGLFWVEKTVSLAFDWVTFPILLALLGGFLGMKRHYALYIVVRNWATVVMMVPFGVLSLLGLAGIVAGDALALASLAAFAFSLWYGYVIARKALQVGVDVAIGVVILDFLVSFAVVGIIARIFGIDAGV